MSLKQTSWTRVWIAYIGGLAFASQLGKVPGAIQPLRDDLGISLTEVGVLIALVPIGTASMGAIGAQLAAHIGVRRSACLGLSLVALGSLLGAMTNTFSALLATRLLEAVGYVLAVVSLPTLVGQSSTDRDRPRAMGLWASYIPAAFALMLLGSVPILEFTGWRGLWVMAGVIPAVIAVLVILCFPPTTTDPTTVPVVSNLKWLLRQPLAWTLTLSFFLFSFQFAALCNFMPVMLFETSELSLQNTNALMAAAIAMNILGNYLGGLLIGRGISLRWCYTVTLLSILILTVIIFLAVIPTPIRVVATFAFGLLSGFMPGAIWASIPAAFPGGTRTTALIGMVMQGAAVGHVTGPVTLGSAVDLTGGNWLIALVIIAIAMLLALLLTWTRVPRFIVVKSSA